MAEINCIPPLSDMVTSWVQEGIQSFELDIETVTMLQRHVEASDPRFLDHLKIFIEAEFDDENLTVSIDDI